MAKKKKGKVVQMLSPVNYIRQKARNLPIHECLINSGWKETGTANILIVRKHASGNITLGIYLVDLYCLGVKDSYYKFNISELDYLAIREDFNSEFPTESVSYTLAHNIIYAALEFADDFGFKPHPDFTSVTQYIIEEDTDDIELINIECGKNGKPLFIEGPNESPKQVIAIIAQLERTAGSGNYDILSSVNSFDEYDEDDDDLDFMDEDYNDILDDDFIVFETFFDEETRKDTKTYQFKIEINGLNEPPVWRRITLPSYFTFLHFHHVIQTVFDWENSHLFQFSEKGFDSKTVITRIYDHLDVGDQNQLEAIDVRLYEIFKNMGDKFMYIYDFGDSWEHTITLEKIIPEVTLSPALLDGGGTCPPEDCGGIYGYMEMLRAFADKGHPEHYEYKEWLGMDDDDDWNPDSFNLEETKYFLKDLFKTS